MAAYTVIYRCAHDNRRFGADRNVIRHESTIVAPSDWDDDEVIEAFLNQRPGSTVLSYRRAQLPHLVAA